MSHSQSSPKQPQSKGPPPGVCVPWEEKRQELPELSGDEQLVKQIWEELDALAYTYIWQCLVSF